MANALSAMDILFSRVSAWPFSSKAMTITAAPKLLQMTACSMNFSSPSLREIELTIHLPCTHFKPASMIENLEESIITGIRAISGSLCRRFRKVTISFCPSSRASSIFMSRICAPLSTCCRAIPSASSYFSSLISLANFLDPVTLVRSPTFTKFVSGRITSGSSPASRI